MGDVDEKDLETAIMVFAHYIGIDIDKEPKLLWIAEEAFEKLPQGWDFGIGEGEQAGIPFFYNEETGESVWNHPEEDYYIRKVKKERQIMRQQQQSRQQKESNNATEDRSRSPDKNRNSRQNQGPIVDEKDRDNSKNTNTFDTARSANQQFNNSNPNSNNKTQNQDPRNDNYNNSNLNSHNNTNNGWHQDRDERDEDNGWNKVGKATKKQEIQEVTEIEEIQDFDEEDNSMMREDSHTVKKNELAVIGARNSAKPAAEVPAKKSLPGFGLSEDDFFDGPDEQPSKPNDFAKPLEEGIKFNATHFKESFSSEVSNAIKDMQKATVASASATAYQGTTNANNNNNQMQQQQEEWKPNSRPSSANAWGRDERNTGNGTVTNGRGNGRNDWTSSSAREEESRPSRSTTPNKREDRPGSASGVRWDDRRENNSGWSRENNRENTRDNSNPRERASPSLRSSRETNANNTTTPAPIVIPPLVVSAPSIDVQSIHDSYQTQLTEQTRYANQLQAEKALVSAELSQMKQSHGQLVFQYEEKLKKLELAAAEEKKVLQEQLLEVEKDSYRKINDLEMTQQQKLFMERKQIRAEVNLEHEQKSKSADHSNQLIIKELEYSKQELTKQLQQVTYEFELLKRKTATASENTVSGQSASSSFMQEKIEFTLQIETLNKSLTEVSNIVTQKDTKIAQLQQELAQYQSQLTQIMYAGQNSKSENESLTRQNSTYGEKMKNLEDKLASEQAKCFQFEQEFAVVKYELVEKRQRYQALEEEHRKGAFQLKAKEERVVELENQIKRMNGSSQMDIQKLSSRVKELEILNTTLTSQLDKSLTQDTVQYTQLQHNHHTMQLQHHSVQEKVYLLQQQYEQCQMTLKQTQKELVHREESRLLKERMLADSESQLAQQKDYHLTAYESWLQEKSGLQQAISNLEEDKKALQRQIIEEKQAMQQEISTQLPSLLAKAKQSYEEQWLGQQQHVLKTQRAQYEDQLVALEHEKEETLKFFQQKEKQWLRKVTEKEHNYELLTQKMKYLTDDYTMLQQEYLEMKNQVRLLEYSNNNTNNNTNNTNGNNSSNSMGYYLPYNNNNNMNNSNSNLTNPNASYQLVPVPVSVPTNTNNNTYTNNNPPPPPPQPLPQPPSQPIPTVSESNSSSAKEMAALEQTNQTIEYLAEQLADMQAQLHATLHTPNPFPLPTNSTHSNSNSSKKTVSFSLDPPGNSNSANSNSSSLEESSLYLAATHPAATNTILNTSSSDSYIAHNSSILFLNDENDPFGGRGSNNNTSSNTSMTSRKAYSTPSSASSNWWTQNTSVESLDDVPTFEHLRTGGYYEGYWKAKYQKPMR